jgi:hypothetical protein
MRPTEFDGWLSGSDSGAYRPSNAAELAERTELAAFRELDGLLRERRRLRVLRGEVTSIDTSATHLEDTEWNRVDRRLSAVESEIDETRRYLASAGWGTESLLGQEE